VKTVVIVIGGWPLRGIQRRMDVRAVALTESAALTSIEIGGRLPAHYRDGYIWWMVLEGVVLQLKATRED